jgi:hypothetical protein
LNRAHGQAQAERWLREGLGAAALKEADLRSLRGSDIRKVALFPYFQKFSIGINTF